MFSAKIETYKGKFKKNILQENKKCSLTKILLLENVYHKDFISFSVSMKLNETLK